eukprot:NODE_1255_length_1809_cov_3.153025_g1190_i0.p1 GENE.NODE_1255_length_1809_cov_3.153025_g1190_i0~~NODE_1255_length_1809_cov_3.153025_g1190_i0.p1  ORF type:complete len:292 (+),score=32.14 NODE_1255_length_1809_cov_3.153025_g1190_i0:631-1506(+)
MYHEEHTLEWAIALIDVINRGYYNRSYSIGLTGERWVKSVEFFKSKTLVRKQPVEGMGWADEKRHLETWPEVFSAEKVEQVNPNAKGLCKGNEEEALQRVVNTARQKSIQLKSLYHSDIVVIGKAAALLSLTGSIPPDTNSSNLFRSLCDQTQTDKCTRHAYHTHYGSLLGPFRQHPLKLLEIGVQRFNSMWLWQSLFPKVRLIAGVDKSSGEMMKKDNLRIFKGDQLNWAFWHDTIRSTGMFDLIIDDGGRTKCLACCWSNGRLDARRTGPFPHASLPWRPWLSMVMDGA